jgi:anti-sigma regulatory factor (Ser/Thr protein kinase)
VVEIVLKNSPEEKPRLLESLQAFAVANRLPRTVLQAAELALEEHITNVLNYAYVDSGVHDIVVRLSCPAGALQVEVEDDGRAFDPLQVPSPDTSMPLEQRPLGGLGIHLMRQYMDKLEYRRIRGRNVLRMTKRFASTPAQ